MKFNSLLIVAIAMLAVACGTGSNKSAEAIVIESVDALVEQAPALVEKVVEVEGICTHLCQHGARKIFIVGSEGYEPLRVEAVGFDVFSQECAGAIVRVWGTVKEERIDEAYLSDWEARNAANTAEEHGENEGGCDTEKAARGEVGNTVEERIAGFRQRIAQRVEREGIDYLSFYYIEALEYEVIE